MCLKLEITLLNCFFQDICLVFLFLINFDNSSPIADAFDPLLHSFAASKCKKGSNASAIGDELSKLMRNIKMRQIS